MPKIDLGAVGAVVTPREGSAFLDAVAELEGMGFSAIWVTGGQLPHLGLLADVVRATSQVKVSAAILSVDRFLSDDVGKLYQDLEATHPGRFFVALGGAHGSDPIGTLNAYLDRLEEVPVPVTRRVMAALGPKMRDLARTRAAGALPVLVTPAFTTQARAHLGDDTTLAIQQLAVVEPDSVAAREAGRRPLGFLGTLPAYQANFRRMGFTDDEIAQRADRLVDGLVPGSDVDHVAAHVRAHLQAGADHVALAQVDDSLDERSLGHWRGLADRLVAR